MPFWLSLLLAYGLGFLSGFFFRVPTLVARRWEFGFGVVLTLSLGFLWKVLVPELLGDLLSSWLQSLWHRLFGVHPPPEEEQPSWRFQGYPDGSVSSRFFPSAASAEIDAQPGTEVAKAALDAMKDMVASRTDPPPISPPSAQSDTGGEVPLEGQADGTSHATGELST